MQKNPPNALAGSLRLMWPACGGYRMPGTTPFLANNLANMPVRSSGDCGLVRDRVEAGAAPQARSVTAFYRIGCGLGRAAVPGRAAADRFISPGRLPMTEAMGTIGA
jgi:hypothetical protein